MERLTIQRWVVPISQLVVGRVDHQPEFPKVTACTISPPSRLVSSSPLQSRTGLRDSASWHQASAGIQKTLNAAVDRLVLSASSLRCLATNPYYHDYHVTYETVEIVAINAIMTTRL